MPTCSEYSMEAYKKYGVAKGTVLTVWRICRCNPLGINLSFFFLFISYGFDILLFIFLLKSLPGG